MILEILRIARSVDRKLEKTLGRPYRVFLSVVLVVAIVHLVRELMDVSFSKLGFMRMAIGIIVGLLLLINQMGELATRMEQRPTRRAGDPSGGRRRGSPPDHDR